MPSMWKDLLFLHGHIARKDDLLWHDQNRPATAIAKPASSSPDRASAALENVTHAPKRRPLHWPRLVAPR